MIKLSDIWNIANLEAYKVHFARFNQHSEPLDVYVRDSAEWQTWPRAFLFHVYTADGLHPS